MAWEVFTYTTNVAGKRQDMVSPIDGRWLFEHGYGLPGRAIFGVLLRRIADGGEVVPENFRPNRSFVDFLHERLGVEAPKTGWQAHSRYLPAQRPAPAADLGWVFRVAGGGRSYAAEPAARSLHAPPERNRVDRALGERQRVPGRMGRDR